VLALASLLGALLASVHAILSGSGRSSPAPRGRGTVRRLARRYDHSEPGRSLATRLWLAQIHLTPSEWRTAQILVGAPLCTVLLATGVPEWTAVSAAISVPRVAGAMVLRARRGASRASLDRGVPLLARALSTELAISGAGGQALVSAVARCRRSPSPSAQVVGHLVDSAAARVVLGAHPADALRRAFDELAPRCPAGSPAALAVGVFGLHPHDAGATAEALEILASTVEHEQALHREVRAAVADARMSAIAVPCIAAATGAMVLATNPAALVAALSMPLLPILAAALVAVSLASIGVRRLTAV
jgi:Flp pilus assembly protein TadB